MRKALVMTVVLLLMTLVGVAWTIELACAADQKEVALAPPKGVKSAAKGKLIINTATGTDLSIQITGLDPKGLYTAFFVNEKSQMFEGIGPDPHVLKVNDKGEASFKGTMTKNIYKRFVMVGIYLNPSGKPIGNPVGVKATLGALMKQDKPKLVLQGKLR